MRCCTFVRAAHADRQTDRRAPMTGGADRATHFRCPHLHRDRAHPIAALERSGHRRGARGGTAAMGMNRTREQPNPARSARPQAAPTLCALHGVRCLLHDVWCMLHVARCTVSVAQNVLHALRGTFAWCDPHRRSCASSRTRANSSRTSTSGTTGRARTTSSEVRVCALPPPPPRALPGSCARTRARVHVGVGVRRWSESLPVSLSVCVRVCVRAHARLPRRVCVCSRMRSQIVSCGTAERSLGR
jgi:hypothetical protein